MFCHEANMYQPGSAPFPRYGATGHQNPPTMFGPRHCFFSWPCQWLGLGLDRRPFPHHTSSTQYQNLTNHISQKSKFKFNSWVHLLFNDMSRLLLGIEMGQNQFNLDKKKDEFCPKQTLFSICFIKIEIFFHTSGPGIM